MTNETFKRILVPFDGSKYSRNALGQTINIAKKFGSEIFIITVVDTSDFPSGMLLAILKKDKMLEESIKQYISTVKSQIRKELLAEVGVCKAKGASETYYDIISGHTVDSILKFMRGRKIDLIVMGSQGRHGLGKIMTLGSVSRRITELATCPVMIVH